MHTLQVHYGQKHVLVKNISITYYTGSFSFDCKPPCLIYGTRHEIKGIELMTSRKVSGLTSLSLVTGIDADVATKVIYWSDNKEKVIKRTNVVNALTMS